MKFAGIAVLALMIVGTIGYLSLCPCGPVPGAWLFGEEHEGKVSDWSFTNDREIAPLCQLQVTTWRPHSINLNCMSTGNSLFISCSNCEGKQWSQDAITHPAAHIRVGSAVYPVTMQRVTDANKLDEIWKARLTKINSEPMPRPNHWWSFHLISR